MPSNVTSLAAAALLLLSLAACGSDNETGASPGNPADLSASATESHPSSSSPTASTSTTPVRYSKKQLRNHLGFVKNNFSPDQVSTRLEGGNTCSVLLLTSADEVSKSEADGAIVVANPNRTAGAKIMTDYKDVCRDLVADLLSNFPAAHKGILEEGPTEESAAAMIRKSQALFKSGEYERGCSFSQSPAYNAVDTDCAEMSKELDDQLEAMEVAVDPVDYDIDVEGAKGKVTFHWDFVGEGGQPAESFQYLQHDGTRWWITGDKETGDLGV